MTEQAPVGPTSILTPAQVQAMIDASLVPVWQQIQAMQGSISTLGQTQQDVARLQSEMTAVQGANTSQDTLIEGHTAELTTLTSTDTTMATALTNLQGDITELEQDVAANTTKNTSQDAAITSLEARVTALETP